VQLSPAHGSEQFVVDTQDIISGENLGYKLVLEVDHNTVPNPYSRDGMAQQMSYMDDTPRYEDANMERLYSHHEANMGDNETQGVDDPHSGTGATQGEQSKDPATQVLRDREI
jgi:hypothetical protein